MVLRSTRQYADVLVAGDGKMRATRQFAEVLTEPDAKARVTGQYVDVLRRGTPKARVTGQYVEVLVRVPSGTGRNAAGESVISLAQNVIAGLVYEDLAVINSLTLTDQAKVGFVKQALTSSELVLNGRADKADCALVSISLSDAAAAELLHLRRGMDTLMLDQAESVQAVFSRRAISEITLTQASGHAGPRTVHAESVITLADTGYRGRTFDLAASQTVSLVGSSGRSGTNRLGATSTLVLQSFADNSVFLRNCESRIELAQEASIEQVITAVSTLDLRHEASEGFVPLRASSEIVFSQIARPNPITIGPGPGYDVEVEVTQIDLEQATNTSSKMLAVEDQIDLAQADRVLKPIYVSATTTLQVTSQEYDLETGEPYEVVTEGLDSVAQPEVARVLRCETRVRLVDEAGVVKIKPDAIALAAESTLELDQDVFKNVTADAVDRLWLTLTHEAIAHCGKLATTEIAVDQEASVIVDLDLGATSTLQVLQAVAFVLVNGTSLKQYAPQIGESTDPNAPTPPPATLQGPVAGIEVPFQLVYPATGTASDSVTLRAPNLGNKDRLAFNRISRETRGGTLIVYADPMWPRTQTLVLQFSGLLRTEALALLQFMETHLGQEIGLVDWEHRYWKGGIVNTTDPAVQDGRDRFTAGFEFEGEPDPTWTGS